MESQLTNFHVYDSETFNTDRVVPSCVNLDRISKICAKDDRDLTPEIYQKCKNDAIVFDVSDCMVVLLIC